VSGTRVLGESKVLPEAHRSGCDKINYTLRVEYWLSNDICNEVCDLFNKIPPSLAGWTKGEPQRRRLRHGRKLAKFYRWWRIHRWDDDYARGSYFVSTYSHLGGVVWYACQQRPTTDLTAHTGSPSQHWPWQQSVPLLVTRGETIVRRPHILRHETCQVRESGFLGRSWNAKNNSLDMTTLVFIAGIDLELL
jgi:hypothetical protein